MPRGEGHQLRKRDAGKFAPRTASSIARRDSGRVARSDVFTSSTTGLGSFNSKTSCDDWCPEIGQGQWTIENAFGFRGIIRRIVSQEPRDALRKPFRISGMEPDSQKALDAFNGRRQFISKMGKLREAARKGGGAALFMDIDDGQRNEDGTQDTSKPVDPMRIQRVGELTLFDRWELNVVGFEHDLAAGDLYRPTGWKLVNLGGKLVHPSRMLVMQGIELSPREMSMNEGMGQSVVDAVWKAARDWMTSHSYMAEAVARKTQGVLKMPALEGAMTGCDSKAVEDRIDMLALWMGALGDIALTGEESYEVHDRSMAGLPEAVRTFFQQLVVETEIPMTILGGQTPGGLNTGENAGEWQSWTSYLGGQLVRVYNPPIRTYLTYVSLAANASQIEFPDDWDLEWDDLYELNATEFSTAVAQLATAGALLVQTGAYSEDEVRNNSMLTKAFPHDPNTTKAPGPQGIDEPDEDETEEMIAPPEPDDDDEAAE